MWYLIVPPIIVVISLSFLLWYLSRRRNDPGVSEKLQSFPEKVKHAFFSRIKEWMLRTLEKQMQRFKVSSLKVHNSLHDWAQSLKERRRLSEDKRRALGESQTENATEKNASVSLRSDVSSETIGGKDQPIDKVIEPAAREEREVSEAPPQNLSFSVLRRRKLKSFLFSSANEVEDREPAPIESEAVDRPMLSEKMTRPEHPKSLRKKTNDVSKEESLIARIATDPKDFSAYEQLGDYYLEAENITDAKECYRQVLKLSPVHRLVKIKIRRLEKILAQKTN